MAARVSICIPNLNTLPFLEERFETILGQTYANWEGFVYDSFSDDGAWEFLQGIAARDPRLRIAQGPRQGPYPAWNECIRQTTADYVYIATSDDTMAPDCLERLVDALDRNPHCDIAHCPLRIIDEQGSPVSSPRWPDVSVFAHWPLGIESRPHVRNAPLDGLLHLTGRHVYLSVTQLLIRRTLFDKIGLFPNRWGSISDFNWEMKAGLVSSTVHVPTTWASWRIHSAQLTSTTQFHSKKRDAAMDEMIQDAFESTARYVAPDVQSTPWRSHSKALRQYYAHLQHEPSKAKRRLYQLKKLFLGESIVRDELRRHLSQRTPWPNFAPEAIQNWLQASGHAPISELPISLATSQATL